MIARAFQHFALALIIARCYGILDFVRTYFRDNALSISHECNEFAVYFGESFA
jgi:hypothetical protein